MDRCEYFNQDNHCEKLQATSMARVAGIELRPNQINDYIFARKCQDKEFLGETDQVLLDLCLDEQQKIQFRKTFKIIMKELPKPNMDFTELLSTMDFILQCENEGVDCTALREVVDPFINAGRVDLNYDLGEVSEKQS